MAKLQINGATVDIAAEDDTPLLWVLRDQLRLTGTKYSCGIDRCGTCTVLTDGEVVPSCVVSIDGLSATDNIVTIEGLSEDGSHPLQQAFAESSCLPADLGRRGRAHHGCRGTGSANAIFAAT
jgi:isoquinoline 1-oxidoreductase alpha subunit